MGMIPFLIALTILLLLFYLIQKNKLVSKNNTKTLDKVISTKIMLAYLRNVITNSYEYKNIENISEQVDLLKDKDDQEEELQKIIKTINNFKEKISETDNYFNKISGSLTGSELIETETKFLKEINESIKIYTVEQYKALREETQYKSMNKNLEFALSSQDSSKKEETLNEGTPSQDEINKLIKTITSKDFNPPSNTESIKKWNDRWWKRGSRDATNLDSFTHTQYSKYITFIEQLTNTLQLNSTDNIISSIFILRHKYIKKYINKNGTGTFWNEISTTDSQDKNLEIITRLRTLPHTEDNKLHNQLLFWTQNVSGDATPKMFALKDVFNTQFVEDYKIFSPSLTITDYSNNEWKNRIENEHHYKPVLDKIREKFEKSKNITLFAYGPSGAGKTVYLYKNEEGEFGGLLKYLLEKTQAEDNIEVGNITITTFIPKYDTGTQEIQFEPKFLEETPKRENIFNILRKIRTERMTTNNNNSSRDHMCITMDITMDITIDDEPKQLVIGDFAGREGIIKYSSFRNKIINLLTNEETEQEPATKSLDIIYQEEEQKETIQDLKIADMIEKAKLLIEKNYYDDIIKNLPEILTKLEKVKENLINNWYYRYFTMTTAKTTEILKKYEVDFKKSKNILEELIDLIESKKNIAEEAIVNEKKINAADYIRFLFDTTTKYLNTEEDTETNNFIKNIETEFFVPNTDVDGEDIYKEYQTKLEELQGKKKI